MKPASSPKTLSNRAPRGAALVPDRAGTGRRRPASRPRALLALGLAGAVLGACRSPEDYRESADAEVYALIDERRAELFAREGGFSIDPPPDGPRARVLSGEWGDPVLSLVDCLDIAAEQSREVWTRRERLYRVALDLTLERFEFGIRPSSSGSAAVTGTGTSAESASADAGFTLSKVLGTGASVVGSIGASLFRLVSTGDGWDVVSDLSLAITQPLLRGAGRRIALEPLTQAERDLVYEVRAYERYRRTFAYQVATNYYSVLQANNSVANEESNLARLQDLTARNEALQAAGRLSELEVDQARQNELRSADRLQSLVADVERRYDEFCLFLGLPIDVRLRLDPAEFTSLEVEDPWLADAEIDSETAVEIALSGRLDLLTLEDEVTDAGRRLVIAEDALRHGLDVSVSASTFSEEGRPLSFSEDDTPWSAGIGWSPPIGNKAQRNSFRNAEISLRDAMRAVEASEDRITAEVRNSLRQLVSAVEGHRIQTMAVVLAERRVESAELMLQAKRANTRDWLEAQDSLLEAQNATTAALVDLTLARMQLYLDMELLSVDDDGFYVDGERALPLTRKYKDSLPPADNEAPASSAEAPTNKETGDE